MTFSSIGLALDADGMSYVFLADLLSGLNENEGFSYSRKCPSTSRG